ncbi:unnamed protein product [Colias eurytheme]|nr:unnamed protein product [Colias eurytheme]
MTQTPSKQPLKEPPIDNVMYDSTSETSSIISRQPTIKISSKNIQLLGDSMMLRNSGSESDEVTASLSMEPIATSDYLPINLETNVTIQVRKAAYRYAEELQIQHTFDQSAQMAGRDWLEGFLKRNNISIRKPEATSINRRTALNNEEVQLFYKLLGDLMEQHKFTPKNIYNCDETGISTVQDPGKILAPKGMKRIGSITCWERGKNITLLCAMNAVGGFVPPMFIFPRKRINPQLEKDDLAGAIYKCSDNGWINENLFFEWLKHFAN